MVLLDGILVQSGQNWRASDWSPGKNKHPPGRHWTSFSTPRNVSYIDVDNVKLGLLCSLPSDPVRLQTHRHDRRPSKQPLLAWIEKKAIKKALKRMGLRPGWIFDHRRWLYRSRWVISAMPNCCLPGLTLSLQHPILWPLAPASGARNRPQHPRWYRICWFWWSSPGNYSLFSINNSPPACASIRFQSSRNLDR